MIKYISIALLFLTLNQCDFNTEAETEETRSSSNSSGKATGKRQHKAFVI